VENKPFVEGVQINLLWEAEEKLIDVQIKCTRKYTSRMQYNGGASARSIPHGVVFLKASLNLK
jgi:hypothetical protein